MLRAGVPKRLNALTLLGGFGCFSSTVSESGCPGRRGAAANSLEISGDCGPAERASGSGAGEGEFIEIQFAETHRDYKFEAANDFSIFRRNAILKNAARSVVRTPRVSMLSFKAIGIPCSGPAPRIASGGFPQSRFFGQREERIERLIILMNPRQAM
jgi:hypothetical protein